MIEELEKYTSTENARKFIDMVKLYEKEVVVDAFINNHVKNYFDIPEGQSLPDMYHVDTSLYDMFSRGEFISKMRVVFFLNGEQRTLRPKNEEQIDRTSFENEYIICVADSFLILDVDIKTPGELVPFVPKIKHCNYYDYQKRKVMLTAAASYDIIMQNDADNPLYKPRVPATT